MINKNKLNYTFIKFLISMYTLESFIFGKGESIF